MRLTKQAQLVAQRIYQRTRSLSRYSKYGMGFAAEISYEECNSKHIYFQSPYLRELSQAKLVYESGTGVYISNRLANLTPAEFLDYIK